MMKEIKTLLQKGGNSPVNITTYAVEIGDALWCRVHDYLVEKYPEDGCEYCSIYRIRGIFEEDGQKYVLLATKGDDVVYKLNFVIDGDSVIFGEELIEGTMEFVPQDGLKNDEEVNEFALQYAANHAEAAVEPEVVVIPEAEVEEPEDALVVEEPVVEPEVEEPVVEPEVDPTPAPASYNLEEIPEYVELAQEYSKLTREYDALKGQVDGLNNTITELSEFKKSIEKKEKQAMIDSFYMLSNEDKKDVQENIDTYSIDTIEAKLSIICVRNRVSFSNLEDNKPASAAPTTYNLQQIETEDTSAPTWMARVHEVAKTLNN